MSVSVYNPIRKRNLYSSNSDKPYQLSRSKLELFTKCQRCFYLDRKLGVGQPPGYPFSLNSAVDILLKKEFDSYREKAVSHPLMISHGIDAIPYSHPDLNLWRDALHGGIRFHHLETNLLISGGIDDVWVNQAGELIIVDYKATSKKEEVTLDAEWQNGYKRQMEIYQWLFIKNGFKVSKTGYFVYCNGDASKENLNARLEFKIRLIPYTGDTAWIEETIKSAFQCLQKAEIPNPDKNCEFCRYRAASTKMEINSPLYF